MACVASAAKCSIESPLARSSANATASPPAALISAAICFAAIYPPRSEHHGVARRGESPGGRRAYSRGCSGHDGRPAIGMW